MTFDLEKIRLDTPGVKNRIHLNNAGASLMPLPVYQSVIDHLDLEMKIGGYEAHHRATHAHERIYDAVAELINADRTEIALVENATVGWQMAFHGLNLKKGDRILTAESEYASNVISYLQMQQKIGVLIDVIPSDETGQIDLNALRNRIDNRTKLIAISHIPTNGGLINPAEKIGLIARQHNIPYLLDACQSVGQIPIDVEKIGCDMLSATGRKYLRGPRGTGFLYVRKDFLDKLSPPFLDLHSAQWTATNEFTLRDGARRFENWESNIAAQIGLGVAVDYLLDIGVTVTSDRLCSLAAIARAQLSDINGITVQDIGQEKGGIVTFSHDRFSATDIGKKLAESQINVSTSAISSTRYDMERRELPSLTRASFHYYNSEEELQTFTQLISNL